MKAAEKHYKDFKTSIDVPICGIEEYSGFHVLRGVLSTEEQIAIAMESLKCYIEPPNSINILKESQGYVFKEPQRELGEKLWDIESIALQNDKEVSKSLRLSRIRWATLGWQYNWTERKYDTYVPFPEQLAALCADYALQCGFGIMKPEAGIVNFYPSGAVMGGHTDEVEETHEPPVVSISIGPPAIFLIGGLTKDEVPTPVLLQSGDIVVMGGASRLRFHAVPRVFNEEGIPAELEKTFQRSDLTAKYGEDLSRLRIFLSSTRINVNVRQVFPSE